MILSSKKNCMTSEPPAIEKTYCSYCGCESIMSTIPQSVHMIKKMRENETRAVSRPHCGKLEHEKFYYQKYMEMSPMKYSSKLMNSIWGLYNRYSVHNFKKNIDKNFPVSAMNQQIQSFGSLEQVDKTAVKKAQLFVPPNIYWASLGY